MKLLLRQILLSIVGCLALSLGLGYGLSIAVNYGLSQFEQDAGNFLPSNPEAEPGIPPP